MQNVFPQMIKVLDSGLPANYGHEGISYRQLLACFIACGSPTEPVSSIVKRTDALIKELEKDGNAG